MGPYRARRLRFKGNPSRGARSSEWTRAEVILAIVAIVVGLSQVVVAVFEFNTNREMAAIARHALAVEAERNVANLEIRAADLSGNETEPRVMMIIANTGLAGTELANVSIHWFFPEWIDGDPLGLGSTHFPRPEDATPGWHIAAATERIFSIPATQHWELDSVRTASMNLTAFPVRGEPSPTFQWDYERFEVRSCAFWQEAGRNATIVVNDSGYYECRLS